VTLDWLRVTKVAAFCCLAGLYHRIPERITSQCLRVANNKEEMFRSRKRNIQASQIFQEAECFVVIRSHAIEDDDVALLTLEPIHSVY